MPSFFFHFPFYLHMTCLYQQSKYCFDLLKAVTMPVNALSTSCSVMEKLEQLSNVLSGKPFSCGPRTVSTDTHPLALRFCLDKLAEKIVVSSGSIWHLFFFVALPSCGHETSCDSITVFETIVSC